jgi:hypothetical protein
MRSAALGLAEGEGLDRDRLVLSALQRCSRVCGRPRPVRDCGAIGEEGRISFQDLGVDQSARRSPRQGDLTKLRWRIERDYQELKQELGLRDYEGRGFHHHAPLCIAAYGFLIAERGALPPSGPTFSAPLSQSAIPDGYRPRGAADPTRAPHPKLDRDHATTPHRRSRQNPPEVPLLQRPDPKTTKISDYRHQ